MTYKQPAMTWLIKNDPDAALAVFHRLRDEYYTHGEEAGDSYLSPRERNPDDIETHDVPDELHTGDTMSESAQDGPDEINIEMLHELQPDLHMMLRSAGGVAWPWCGVRVKLDGKVKWVGEPWAYEFAERVGRRDGGHVISLKGLTYYTRPSARSGFEGGMLLSYVNDAGQVERPALKANKPRGGKRPHRGDPAGYIALPGAIASPLAAEGLQRPLSDERAIGDYYDPQPRPVQWITDGKPEIRDARDVLADLGINGSVPFDCLPFPATKCPDRMARRVRFIGGITGAKQTASIPAPAWQEREPVALSPVLDEVAARGTLASIGIRMGKKGGYADRFGKMVLLAAGRALIADNDNISRKVAA